MAVTVPASDQAGTFLQGVINNLATHITNNATHANVHEWTRAKAAAEATLVAYLVSERPAKLNAGTILSVCTYGT